MEAEGSRESVLTRELEKRRLAGEKKGQTENEYLYEFLCTRYDKMY